jgi:hypothetical protein
MNSTSAWFMPMIKPRGKQLLLAAPRRSRRLTSNGFRVSGDRLASMNPGAFRLHAWRWDRGHHRLPRDGAASSLACGGPKTTQGAPLSPDSHSLALAREKFPDLIGHIDELLDRIFIRYRRPPLLSGLHPECGACDDLAGKARFVFFAAHREFSDYFDRSSIGSLITRSACQPVSLRSQRPRSRSALGAEDGAGTTAHRGRNRGGLSTLAARIVVLKASLPLCCFLK